MPFFVLFIQALVICAFACLKFFCTGFAPQCCVLFPIVVLKQASCELNLVADYSTKKDLSTVYINTDTADILEYDT